MKPSWIIVPALLLAVLALGQNYGAAERRARQAVQQTQQASQGGNDTSTPQTYGVQPHAPPALDPVLKATQENIANLQADFSELKTNVPPKPAFTNDLTAAAMGAKASPASVAKLAGDLQTAIGGNETVRAQHQKLAQDIHALFNRSNLTPVQAMTVSNDVQRILRVGGAAPETADALADDIKTIEDETR